MYRRLFFHLIFIILFDQAQVATADASASVTGSPSTSLHPFRSPSLRPPVFFVPVPDPTATPPYPKILNVRDSGEDPSQGFGASHWLMSAPNARVSFRSGLVPVFATSTPTSTSVPSPDIIIQTTSTRSASSVASTDGIIIGRLLTSLTHDGKKYSTDIKIQATQAAFIKDIENDEDALKNLFTKMGGSLPPSTGGCSPSFRRSRRSLGNLLGDVFNTARCAIHGLEALKGHVNIPDPDFPTIEKDLGDLGSLADEINPDGEEEKHSNRQSPSRTDDPVSSTQGRSVSSSPSSWSSASPTVASTASSTADNPCLQAPLLTSGTQLRKRQLSSDRDCPSACPASMPNVATTGELAITPAPLDTEDQGTLAKRDIAGRIKIEKRAQHTVVAVINGCKLSTPHNSQITIPAYPGGGTVLASEIAGQMPESWQGISRYLKTTAGSDHIGTANPPQNAGNCAPIVTAVPAQQASSNPHGDIENERVTTDHAYEKNWLTGYMSSIITKSAISTDSKFSCNDANKVFFNFIPHGNPSCRRNLLAPVYAALASEENPDFVMMSEYLNSFCKGWIMGPGFRPGNAHASNQFFDPKYTVTRDWAWEKAEDNLQFKINYFKAVLMGCLVIKSNNVIPLIERTNDRIYQAFYKSYMQERMATINEAPSFVWRMIEDIYADLTASGELRDTNEAAWNTLVALYTSYNTRYMDADGRKEWEFSINLRFEDSNAKRELGGSQDELDSSDISDSCSLPSDVGTVSAPAYLSEKGTTQRISSQMPQSLSASFARLPASIATGPGRELSAAVSLTGQDGQATFGNTIDGVYVTSMASGTTLRPPLSIPTIKGLFSSPTVRFPTSSSNPIVTLSGNTPSFHKPEKPTAGASIRVATAPSSPTLTQSSAAEPKPPYQSFVKAVVENPITPFLPWSSTTSIIASAGSPSDIVSSKTSAPLRPLLSSIAGTAISPKIWATPQRPSSSPVGTAAHFRTPITSRPPLSYIKPSIASGSLQSHPSSPLPSSTSPVEGSHFSKMATPMLSFGTQSVFMSHTTATTHSTTQSSVTSLSRIANALDLTDTAVPLPTHIAPVCPYAQGICSASIDETKGNGYTLKVFISDNHRDLIGHLVQGNVSAANPLKVPSSLEDLLICVPETENGWIQFTLGSQVWLSDGDFVAGEAPNCTVKPWEYLFGDTYSRHIDCNFVCTYGGGKSSDGTMG